MIEIQFGAHILNCASGETALDALLRHHVPVPWSCKAGLCHSCMIQATDGSIPNAAQQGLTQEQKDDGYLLACQCLPEAPLKLQPLRRALQPMQAVITHVKPVTPTMVELTVSPRLPLTYRPGQFLNFSLEKDDNGTLLTLISRPWAEPDLRVYVSRKVGGGFSSWIFDEAEPGKQIWLKDLGGEACYAPDHHQPLILFGSDAGTGAALAVAEDAFWHEPNQAIATILTGEQPDNIQHQLPADSIIMTNKASLEDHTGRLLNDPRFRGARWILFGTSKPVLALTAWLGERGVARENVLPLPYRKA